MPSTGRAYRSFLVFVGACLVSCVPLAAQEKPNTQENVPTTSSSDVSTCCSDIGRNVSLHQLPHNILADQRDVWLFPIKLGKGEHVWPAIAIAGVTAGVVASDPYSAPPFR